MIIKVLPKPIRDFTHVIHLADIQIRLTKRHDEYKDVFDRLYKTIEQTPLTTIVCILGDIVHSKLDLSPECVQTTKDFLGSVADLRTTILVAGNHDTNLTNRNRLDSLSPIVDAIKHPNLFYLKESGLYGIGNICFNNYSVFDPKEKYLAGKDIPQVYRSQYKYLIALFHGSVDNAKTDLGFLISNKMYPISTFDGHDIALLGDIHLKQDLQKYDWNDDKPAVHYCGSLVQQNHGETLDGHGVSFWNLENRDYTHIEIPNDFGYYTVMVNQGNLVTDISNIPKKSRLRIQFFETTATDLKVVLNKIKLVTDVVEISHIRLESPNEQVKSTLIEEGVTASDLSNMDLQEKLLKTFIEKHNQSRDNYLLEDVLRINRDTNSVINKDDIAKNIRWKPIKFEFDNMFSYGESNTINFSKFKDVIGLFAANTSGKSSILSALSFCIFDKCERDFKASSVLNVQKMNFKCLFEFEISGIHYFIEREGTSDKKGNVSVTVKFWKLVDGNKIDLHGEDRRETNNIIREYLGTYDDFVLTSLSVQNIKNVASFIDMGNSERKDLLAQFMGLIIYDKLHEKANLKLNELVSVLRSYKNDDYEAKLTEIGNGLSLAQSLFTNETELVNMFILKKDTLDQEILEETKKLVKIEGNIPSLTASEYSKERHIAGIDANKKSITIEETNLVKYKEQLSTMDVELKKMEDLEIPKVQIVYDSYVTKKNDIQRTLDKKKVEISYKKEKEKKASGYTYNKDCDFCSKNALPILSEGEKAKKELIKDKVDVEELLKSYNEIEENIGKLSWLKDVNENYTKLLKKKNDVNESHRYSNSKLEVYRNQLKDSETGLKKAEEDILLFNKNKAAIEANKLVESQIDIIKHSKSKLEIDIKMKSKIIMELNGKMSVFKSQIEDITKKINKVKEVEKEYNAYNAYVQAVGRDGIPYEVICSTMPRIEREVNSILTQIAEFTARFETDGKNVVPYLVYEDKKWGMGLSSGFEKFVASLAIRVALINISNLPRPNFLVIDEGFGVLDAENLPSMQTMFSYFKNHFDFILIVSHLEAMRDMVDSHLEIKKENGFSKVEYV